MTKQKHVQFPADSDAEDLPTRIVEVFEEMLETDQRELPLLYEHIDPDVLENLVTERGRDTGFLRIDFEYCGHVVTVYQDGKIVVEPTQDD